MKKSLIVLLSLVLSISLLVGCSSGEKAPEVKEPAEKVADGEVIELTYGHIQNPGHSLYVAAEDFAKLVEERTEGKVKIATFPSSSLGTAREMMEQAAMGTLDITFAGTSDWASALNIPELGVYDLPFLYADLDVQHKLINEILVKDISERMEATPVRLLHVFSNGIRNPLIKTKPITSLADIKDMKMRTPENPLFVDTWTALGATVVTSPWAEVYTVVQQGVADACEADAVGMINMNLQEVGNYYSKIGHMGSVYVAAINSDVWDTIPEDLQQIIMECGQESTKAQVEKRKADDALAEEQLMEAGVEINDITEENRGEMIKAVAGIHEKFATQYNLQDLIDSILALK